MNDWMLPLLPLLLLYVRNTFPATFLFCDEGVVSRKAGVAEQSILVLV